MEAKSKAGTDAREEIHQLVDELPDGEIHAARRYVEYLLDQGDPFLKKLREVCSDPATKEEIEAIQEGRRAVAEGDVVGDDQMRAELEV